jgi:hypothetical protein
MVVFAVLPAQNLFEIKFERCDKTHNFHHRQQQPLSLYSASNSNLLELVFSFFFFIDPTVSCFLFEEYIQNDPLDNICSPVCLGLIMRPTCSSDIVNNRSPVLVDFSVPEDCIPDFSFC